MRLILTAGLFALMVLDVHADNWPNWHGPHFNGKAEGKGYPTEWSESKNLAWKVALPGRGSSTPIVWDDHVFLTCGVDGKNTVLDYTLDGKERWRKIVGTERPGKHKKASGANSSCVTDGQLVFAYFKSGDVSCLDFLGKPVWNVNLQEKYGEDTLWWDLGTSPVLTKKHCVIAVMQTGGSYLVAFDKVTGAEAWKVDRNLEAPREAAQSYSTPIVTQHNGQEILIVLGADHVTAHRAENGAEIWRVGGLNPTQHEYFRSISSPALADGYVIAPYARGGSVSAIKLGGKGDVTSTNVVWQKKENGPDVPTPAVSDGKTYLLSDKGVVTCIDIKSGTEIWSGITEKNRQAYSSSPILADGKIYVTREDGKTFVLAQGSEFKVLAANEITPSQTVATLVFVNGRILLRSDTDLYCFANKP